MSFISLAMLESWLAEFEGLGYPGDRSVRVLQQDGAEGANTGLVSVKLSSGLSAYLQPVDSAGRWKVTLASIESAIALDPAEVSRLSEDLATVSALCAYLQARSSGAEA